MDDSNVAGATQEVAQEEAQPGIEKFITSASKEKDARKITTVYNFGKDLDEAAELHGKEVVYGMYVKAMKVAIQANLRQRLSAVDDAGNPKFTDEQIDAFVQNEYKPGVRSARVGGGQKAEVTKLVAKLKEANLSVEDLLAMIAAQSGTQASE